MGDDATTQGEADVLGSAPSTASSAPGFQVTKRSIHEALFPEVALKLLLRARAFDPTAQQRLLREAQVLARLSHPNVVQIHEAGVHDGSGLPGDGVGRRRDVARVAGRGLAAAHASGLTHRDFKPDNVQVQSRAS